MRAGNAPVAAVMRRMALAAAAFVLVMAAIWGIGPDAAPPSARRPGPGKRRPNVVLIIIEAMAPAHCSLYGYERDTTPFLRELAAECVVFEEAYATSSWTRPSVASIFTGLYPSQHAALEIKDRLSPELLTLAEVLKANGYTTAAFCTNNVIADRQFNYWQGFETFVWVHLTRFEALLPPLSEWLVGRPQEPFFLYMHVFDPHLPYEAPGGFRDMYAEGHASPLAALDDLNPVQVAKVQALTPDDVEYVKARYDAELAYTDHGMSRVVKLFQDHGLWDNSFVVLTADHGEGSYQRGTWGHTQVLYPEQIHVPLMIKLPGGAHRGTRIYGLASGIDLLPTTLRAVGLAVPGGVQGIDLLDNLAAGRTGRRYYYGEFLCRHEDEADRPSSWAFLDDAYHYMVYQREGSEPKELLFDRRADPMAEHDLSAERPEVVRQYSEQMGRIQQNLAPVVAREQASPDEETMQSLRDLGYR